MSRKPILCLDFDGVLHLYSSGWNGAACIPDPPVPGAMAFLVEAVEHFQVAVFSARSGQQGGLLAMKDWLREQLTTHFQNGPLADDLLARIDFPTRKPAAFVTLDDRALTFSGTFPPVPVPERPAEPRYLGGGRSAGGRLGLALAGPRF